MKSFDLTCALLSFIRADKTIRNEEYYAALTLNQKVAREDGIDATLKKFNLDCMVLPSGGEERVATGLLGLLM